MRTFYSQNIRNFRDKSPCENRKENKLIKNFTSRKKVPLYLSDSVTHFYPYKKYIQNNPFPYISIMKKTSSNFNLSNRRVENEKFTPYYKNSNKSSLYPFFTKKDLLKYLKRDGSPQQRSLPAIIGRSCDKKFKVIHKYKVPTLTRNQSSNLRHKIINFNTVDKNRSVNLNTLYPIEERKNEENEEYGKLSEVVNEERKEKILSLKNFNAIFYKPKKKTNFRNVQIFNHFKPFLVDEFKEYAALN